MGKLATLKAELLSGHPVTGAYNASDSLAADQGNVLDIDSDGGVLGMIEYILKNRSRTNNGTDTTPTAMFGRLQSVADGAVSDDPFGSGQTLTMEHIHSAKMFVHLLSSPQVEVFDFVNNEVSKMFNVLGGGPGNARVWKAADITALKGLSQNTISRFQELKLGTVRAETVTSARALP